MDGLKYLATNDFETFNASIKSYRSAFGLTGFDAAGETNYYPNKKVKAYFDLLLRYNQLKFRCVSPKRNQSLHFQTSFYSLEGKFTCKWTSSAQGSSTCNAFDNLPGVMRPILLKTAQINRQCRFSSPI